MGRTSDAKERLLTAAIELIHQKSFGSVSVDDICEASGVKKGSFYHFFKSKTELVVEALEYNWVQHMRPMLDRCFSPSLAPVDRFRSYFQYAYEKQAGFHAKFGRVLGCPLCSIGSEASQVDQAICDKVQQIMELYDRYWTTTIRDYLAQKGRNAGDLEVVSNQLDAYMSGIMTQARIKNDPEIVRQLEAGGLRILGESESSTKGAA
jgi:TetR/AcrR family transcriptional regulator, transcriptional repressor for nem operon